MSYVDRRFGHQTRGKRSGVPDPVLQFLLSTPRRLRAGLPGKARKPRHTSERIEPTLSVAAMTAQSEPSNNVVALASPRALR